MDPPRFADLYRSVLGWLVKCGLLSPWAAEPPLLTKTLLLCYDAVLVVIVCYMLFLHIYSLTKISSPFPELFVFMKDCSLYGCSISITFYIALCKGRLRTITDSLDSIIATIFRNELGGAHFLEQHFKKNAKMMAVLTNNSLFISFTIPVTYFFSVTFSSWLAGKYRSRLPIPIESPYNYRVPIIYELMVVLITSSLVIACAKKAIAECLFMSIFNAQITILKYLYAAKQYLSVKQENGDNIFDRKKLMIWIKLQQEINQNIGQLIETFSPLLIIYSVAVVTIVVSGAALLLMYDYQNLILPITVVSFIAITVLYYYLLSNTAEELSTEAQKLAFVAYDLPWYEMKKSDADIVRMVIFKTNRPIHVTAYCAPVFMLNRETFNAFMATTISAFLTMSQIKDRFDYGTVM